MLRWETKKEFEPWFGSCTTHRLRTPGQVFLREFLISVLDYFYYVEHRVPWADGVPTTMSQKQRRKVSTHYSWSPPQEITEADVLPALRLRELGIGRPCALEAARFGAALRRPIPSEIWLQQTGRLPDSCITLAVHKVKPTWVLGGEKMGKLYLWRTDPLCLRENACETNFERQLRRNNLIPSTINPISREAFTDDQRHLGNLACVEWYQPDPGIFLTGSYIIRIWDTSRFKVVSKFDFGMTCCLVSSASIPTLFAMAAEQSSNIRLGDMRMSTGSQTLLGKKQSYISCLSWVPGRSHELVSLSSSRWNGSEITHWDIRGGRPIGSQAGQHRLLGFCISQNSKRIYALENNLSSRQNEIKVYNLRTFNGVETKNLRTEHPFDIGYPENNHWQPISIIGPSSREYVYYLSPRSDTIMLRQMRESPSHADVAWTSSASAQLAHAVFKSRSKIHTMAYDVNSLSLWVSHDPGIQCIRPQAAQDTLLSFRRNSRELQSPQAIVNPDEDNWSD